MNYNNITISSTSAHSSSSIETEDGLSDLQYLISKDPLTDDVKPRKGIIKSIYFNVLYYYYPTTHICRDQHDNCDFFMSSVLI